MPMQPTLSTGGRLLRKVYPGEKYDITEYPKDNTPDIIKLLNKHKKSKLSVIEILCKDSGYSYDKRFIFDRGGRVKTAGEFLEREYGIRRDSCKCPYCDESQQIDTILFHLTEGYGKKGHRVGINNVIEFLKTVAN